MRTNVVIDLNKLHTHGYRHWQEILSDPRFEILNRAFKQDVDRQKRAAFLNRRFQVSARSRVWCQVNTTVDVEY